MKHLWILNIILLSSCTHNENAIQTARQPTLIIQQSYKWTNAQFTVYPATGGSANTITGYETSVSHPRDTNRHALRLSAFMMPKSRATWTGCPQDVYIESGHEVVGVSVHPLIGLQFMPSLVASVQVAESGLKGLAKHVVATIDYDAAFGHAVGGVGGRVKGVTGIDLREVFKKSLFRTYGSIATPDEYQQLTSYSVEKGVLRMDLTRFAGRDTGTVWIRIADRTLIRATENGVQVYPEQGK